MSERTSRSALSIRRCGRPFAVGGRRFVGLFPAVPGSAAFPLLSSLGSRLSRVTCCPERWCAVRAGLRSAWSAGRVVATTAVMPLPRALAGTGSWSPGVSPRTSFCARSSSVCSTPRLFGASSGALRRKPGICMPRSRSGGKRTLNARARSRGRRQPSAAQDRPRRTGPPREAVEPSGRRAGRPRPSGVGEELGDGAGLLKLGGRAHECGRGRRRATGRRPPIRREGGRGRRRRRRAGGPPGWAASPAGSSNSKMSYAWFVPGIKRVRFPVSVRVVVWSYIAKAW